MIIAIIGIDGAGKTTQVKLLQEKFCEMNRRTCHFKAKSLNRNLVEKNEQNMCNYFVYKKLLKMAMTLDFLIEYDKMCEANEINIWDRYSFCIEAYFMAESICDENIASLLKNIKQPDLLVWLKMSPYVAEQRVRERGVPKSLENAEFLKRVDKCYDTILKEVDKIVIDCTDLTAEEISTIIWNCIIERKLV